MPGERFRQQERKLAVAERRQLRAMLTIAVLLSLFGSWTLGSSGVFDPVFLNTSQPGRSKTLSAPNIVSPVESSSSSQPSRMMLGGKGESLATQQADSVSACLVDDAHSDRVVLFNATTGDYQFCCGGVVVASGRGSVSVVNGTIFIHHLKGNRTVDISITQSGSGTASIQKNGTPICQITDTTMLGDVFTCPSQPSFAAARVDSLNRTGQPGEDLFSGNYNWSLPIAGLAGRAGLGLGLSLTCNSLVWTRDGSSIGFDADNGFPSPGFRLGFPTIQQEGYVSQSGSSALLMILPSGGRVELRQVSAGLYESADSSWLQLDTSTSPMILRTADGTQLSFQFFNGEYRCTQVKDRNGNYITVAYDTGGHITSITDTLARSLSFVYVNNHLQKITQQWNGTEHKWAQFDYASLSIQTSFSGLSIVGPQNGTSITVLSEVTLDDDSYFSFDYTSYGQVKKISHNAADDHLLASAAYDMNTGTGQTDCPRFTTRTDYAENWNTGNTVNTSFTFDHGTGSGQVTTPDGTVTKETHAVSGYKKGLTTQTDTYSSDNSSTPKKTVVVTWTQDDTGLMYPLNPRVTQTDVSDDSSNHRKTEISYSSQTLPPNNTVCKLPSDVKEYDSLATAVLRNTHTDYVTTSAYLNQHIIGLPSARYLYDSDSQGATPVSKVTFAYDASGSLSSQGEPVQHDSSYGTGFTTRGNSTSVTRWDVTTLGDQNPQSVTTTMAYNTAGDLISTSDPLSHQVTISYTDSFATTGTSLPSSTLAYPTTVTDADSNSSTTQYDYDIGAVRVTTDPKGASRTTTYDTVGRVSRIDISNGAYTRFDYPSTLTQINTYSLIQTGGAEFYSTQVLDGAGRVRATASDFPGSTGLYRGQYTIYDLMGRVSQQSNPTEMDSSWTPKGDDQTAGWLYTTQTYDWKGRPRITTNTDTTTRTVTYGGCGCAGGEVVTNQDEVGRQQRMTYEVLGRLVKTESLNTDQNHTVYATRTDTYNVRDQITNILVQQGTNGTGQQTSMTYDGHGRLVTRKVPIEDSTTSGTTYVYNTDDTVQKVTDARGASSTYTYNGRHLITFIHYAKPGASAPTAIPNAPDISFTYDDAGNRLTMTDGLGSLTYAYDTWSKLTSETRYFTDLAASYQLRYEYNLAGGLTKLYDPFNGTISYAFNSSGQVTGVTGTHYAGVTQFASGMQYRAWGGLKHATYFNNGSVDLSYNGRLQMTHYAGGSASDFQYYADGRVKSASSIGNNTFDRAYTYDQVGRLTQGLTGKEARGEPGVDGPYKQSYSYNVWDNMTSRNNRFWTQPDDLFTATYVNDRNSAWVYNASGNVTQDTLHHVYDAAGRQTSTNDSIGVMSIAQDYDGDGQPGKRIEDRQSLTTAITTYYLRSSVLGGQVVTEIIATGFRSGTHNTHLYVNGSEIALYDSWVNQVISRLSNPVTGSGWQELDPLGGLVGFVDPFVQNPNTTYDSLHANEALYLEDGNPFDPGGGCTLDGLPVSCEYAAGRAASGAAAVAPMRDVIPVWYNGELTLAFFQAFADGYQGYAPLNVREDEGRIRAIGPPKFFRGRVLERDTDLRVLNGVTDKDPEVVLAKSTGFEVEGGQREYPPKYDKSLPRVEDVGKLGHPTEHLSDCVTQYLAKYFDKGVLKQITIRRDYLPPIAPKDARAFTPTGDQIFFNKNEYQPNTIDGIGLIGHEVAHIFQARKYGDAAFGLIYLGDSAAMWLMGGDAYTDNAFEKAAFAKQDEILKDLYRNGNPCP